jgi:hypothetical protein
MISEGEQSFQGDLSDQEASNNIENSDVGSLETVRESALRREQRFNALWSRPTGSRFVHWSVMAKEGQHPPIDILANVIRHGIKTRKQLESEGVEAGGWGLQGEDHISVLPDDQSSYRFEGFITGGYPVSTVIIDPDVVQDRIVPAKYSGAAEHLNEKML